MQAAFAVCLRARRTLRVYPIQHRRAIVDETPALGVL
jgi:hypothetical protein